MAKVFLVLSLLALSISSCKKKHEVSKDTYEYFAAHLKSPMSYNEIVVTFGTPDGDLGSGIHIYYYNLNDGTGVWIGYTDKIIYARHMSSSNKSTAQLLHTIL